MSNPLSCGLSRAFDLFLLRLLFSWSICPSLPVPLARHVSLSLPASPTLQLVQLLQLCQLDCASTPAYFFLLLLLQLFHQQLLHHSLVGRRSLVQSVLKLSRSGVASVSHLVTFPSLPHSSPSRRDWHSSSAHFDSDSPHPSSYGSCSSSHPGYLGLNVMHSGSLRSFHMPSSSQRDSPPCSSDCSSSHRRSPASAVRSCSLTLQTHSCLPLGSRSPHDQSQRDHHGWCQLRPSPSWSAWSHSYQCCHIILYCIEFSIFELFL